MKRLLSLVLLVTFALAIIPPVSAQFGTLTPSSGITVVRGDYSTGTLYLSNGGGVSYSVVSYQRFWVEDSSGKTVGGFNFTMSPRAFSNWRSGDKKSVWYNISCSGNVTPGNYTLHLRFIATTLTGEVVILYSTIPLEVIGSPLKFQSAETYVPGRGKYSFAFIGEKVVVYSHIVNIGHKTIPVDARVALYFGTKAVYSSEKSVNVPPGDTLVKFEVPIGLDYKEGSYRLVYTLKYFGGTYTFTKDFNVLVGIRLVSVSVQSDSVKLNEPNRAYVTILSERNATVRLVADFRAHNETVGRFSKSLNLSPGTAVVEVPLPTNVSGNVSTTLRLLLGDRLIGSKEFSYSVVAPPRIVSVVPNVSDGELSLKVLVSNPGQAVQGTLTYVVWLNGEVVYNDTVVQTFASGNNSVHLMLKLPGTGEVKYLVAVSGGGATSSVNGTIKVAPPVTTTSTTTSQTTTTSWQSNVTSTTSTTSSGGHAWWPVLVLLLIVLVAVGAYYLYGGSSSKKKRRRKKPKRRSPLGRFKRPKPPKFHERDSLPKKK
jgi:hypothetical protein